MDFDTEKEGRRIARVTFYMLDKKPEALRAAEMAGSDRLDGQVTWEEVAQILNEDSVKRRFFRENS